MAAAHLVAAAAFAAAAATAVVARGGSVDERAVRVALGVEREKVMTVTRVVVRREVMRRSCSRAPHVIARHLGVERIDALGRAPREVGGSGLRGGLGVERVLSQLP